MMSENQSRRVLGEHKVVESIQSIADWVTKAKKVMSDIKSNKVDYNFYEITSDLEEDIARTDSDIEKEVLTGLLHSLNNAYSKIADKEDIREDKELLVEDLDEAFYEKICRAYIDTVNLEWVTTNPENNDSVVHGYFANDDVAEKWEYGAKVTPENFKDAVYDGYTQEEVEDQNIDCYEYDTWLDFYEDIVRSNIDYDIDDIGVYDFNDNWDFYISEEDLTKLGLWGDNQLDESKKVTESSKSEIYDELSRVLTDYEGNGNKDLKDDPKPLYDMLVKIQNNWEDTITSNLDESKKVIEGNEDVFSNLMKEIADLPDAGLDYKGICATIVGDMAGMAGLENNVEAMAKVNIDTVREIADAVFEEDSIWEPLDDFIYSSIYGRLGIDY